MSGTSGGYAKGCAVNDAFGLVTTVYEGSSTTYLCDGGWFNNARVRFAIVGADCCGVALRELVLRCVGYVRQRRLAPFVYTRLKNAIRRAQNEEAKITVDIATARVR